MADIDEVDALEVRVQTLLLARFDGLPTEPVLLECPKCRAVQTLFPNG